MQSWTGVLIHPTFHVFIVPNEAINCGFKFYSFKPGYLYVNEKLSCVHMQFANMV